MTDNDVVFECNLGEALKNMNNAAVAFLHEASGELESQVKVNTRVDTTQTKNHWTYRVDEQNLTSTIGNPMENAIWEEFGTGQYALRGNGRNSPWRFRDRHGRWWTTSGKRGTRAFYRAFKTTAPRIQSEMVRRFKL